MNLTKLKLIDESRCNKVYVNTTNGTLERVCKYDYNGQGIEYQVGDFFLLNYSWDFVYKLTVFLDSCRSSLYSCVHIYGNISVTICRQISE